ncbi:SDR family NAD(P)-dependent oxidoreductase [Rubrivirga marina]|nr:SDR family NAD(P)-dependent oxidoreductase [Rubrivirga marina]
MADFQTTYGPWAVVTGASSGIGRAFAEALATRGLNVVLTARREAALATLAEALRQTHGVEARVVPADLGTEAGVAAVEGGSADLDVGLLVASAGFGTSGAFLESDLGDEIAMLDVNVRAVARLTHGVGRRLVARGRGGIVLLGSLVGFQGTPFAAHYAATKAYVQTLGEALHVELAPRGVDVVVSAPGPVDTGFAEVADMQMGAALTPDAVVGPTLAALGRRQTVRPGLLTKVLTAGLSPLPRWARVRVMGRVMGGMTEHQRA